MSDTKFIMGMRDVFFNALYEIFTRDEKTVFITADNGAPTLDRFGDNFPDRYFTVGIAEQQMIGMACGMAVEGRKVYTYAIAPFITLRCFEQNKIDMCAMNLPIVSIGVGRGYAYDIMGPTHHTTEDISVMRALPNLKIHNPADHVTTEGLVAMIHDDPSPQYIRFDRAGIDNIYAPGTIDPTLGVIEARRGRDLCFIATGIMVHQALKVAQDLEARGIQAGVIDICRLKPVNQELLLRYLEPYPRAVTLEEHQLAGGLGSIVAEIFLDRGVVTPTLRIGQQDKFVFDNGGRQAIWEKHGLDRESVGARVAEFAQA